MEATAEELLFGPLAQRLGVRAIPVSAGPDRRVAAGEEVRRPAAFAFDPAGLDSGSRAELARLESARFSVYAPHYVARGGDAEAREGLLSVDLAELAQLGDSSGTFPAVELFLAAQARLDAPPGRPRLMGIVNVTPDSFSDGGRFLDPGQAIEHGLRLAAEGADLLDVGGESTRPGAEAVPASVELERVLPVIEGLVGSGTVPVSVDTQKAAVARAALDAGAELVNDVSAGRKDPGMLPLVSEAGCGYVAMHMQGTPQSMQRNPRYTDPVREVADFLRERGAACLKAGVALPKITFDPGIGFGKRLDANLEILRRLRELRSLGRPLLLGVSRKSFIAHLTGEERQEDWKGRAKQGDRAAGHVERLGGSAAAVAACVLGGADVLRVHDVRVMSEAVRVAQALRDPDSLPH